MTPTQFVTVQHLARILAVSDETVRRRIVQALLVPDGVVKTYASDMPVFRADRMGEISAAFNGGSGSSLVVHGIYRGGANNPPAA
ncbi:MAG TPA: hypothetical protein PLN52_22695 [Opitutaceae bacterium]|nr:hypothetical protein [Opitutaceae bacterium]